MSTTKWLKLETLVVNCINSRSLFLCYRHSTSNYVFFFLNKKINFLQRTFLIMMMTEFLLDQPDSAEPIFLHFSLFFFAIFIHCIFKFSLLYFDKFLFFCLLVLMKDSYPKLSMVFPRLFYLKLSAGCFSCNHVNLLKILFIFPLICPLSLSTYFGFFDLFVELK